MATVVVDQVSRFLARGQFLVSRIDNSINTLQSMREMITSVQNQDSSRGARTTIAQLEAVASGEASDDNLRDLLSSSIKSHVQSWCLDYTKVKRTLVHTLGAMRIQLEDFEQREADFKAKLQSVCRQEKYLCLEYQLKFDEEFPTKLKSGQSLIGRQVIMTFFVNGSLGSGLGLGLALGLGLGLGFALGFGVAAGCRSGRAV